jgi:hypothetical protein
MANFAVIKNNKVTNLIVSDSKETAEQITGLTCVEYTDIHSVGIDWTYNGTTFEAPETE